VSKTAKFGSNHVRAMRYLGLAELGNALFADSNIAQKGLENGIWGHGDSQGGKPEIIVIELSNSEPAAPEPRPAGPTNAESPLDRHVQAAKAEASREQARTPEAEKPAPEIDRD
jgi:hypothetical protein